MRETVAIDFDNTLYQPSAGDSMFRLFGKPMPGAVEFVRRLLQEEFQVVIFTLRAGNYESSLAASEWLLGNGFPVLNITNVKPPAAMYLDDKGWRFTGSFDEPLAELLKSRETLERT